MSLTDDDNRITIFTDVSVRRMKSPCPCFVLLDTLYEDDNYPDHICAKVASMSVIQWSGWPDDAIPLGEEEESHPIHRLPDGRAVYPKHKKDGERVVVTAQGS